MKPSWQSGIVALCLVLLSSCGALVGTRPPTPTPPVALESLLLDGTLFPGWEQGADQDPGCSVLGCDDRLERVYRQFTYKSPHTAHLDGFDAKMDVLTTHQVTRYRSFERARNAYQTLESGHYAREPGIDYTPTNEITYTSPHAQHMLVVCSKKPRVFCNTLAQYGVYLVEFASYIDDDVMSYTDYERILAEIDRTMEAVADIR